MKSENKTTHPNINFEPYLNKINAYAFSFLEKSITGRLIEKNGNFITVELRSGSMIVAHIDSLVSIWHIRQKQAKTEVA